MKRNTRSITHLFKLSILVSIAITACQPAPKPVPETTLQAPDSPAPEMPSSEPGFTNTPILTLPVSTALTTTRMPTTPLLSISMTRTPSEVKVTQGTEPAISTPTPPSPSSLAGIETHYMNGIDLVQQAGVYWVRRNALLWSQVEPAQGDRNWGNVASLEKELVELTNKGLHTILIIRSTPAWAQKFPGYLCGPITAEKFDAFGQFLYDAVRRYSAPPYKVRFFELWNEPDVPPSAVPPTMVFGCWGDPDSFYYGGEYYGNMLKVVYPKIKDANKDALVVLGGLLLDCDPNHPPETTKGSGVLKDCTSSKFLSGVLESGGGASFDGVSFHAYDYYNRSLGRYSNFNWWSAYTTSGPSLIAKAQYLRGVLDAYGLSDKFLMNTENALICGSSGEEAFCLTGDYQSTKAIYAIEALAAGGSVGLQANIWYSLNGWRGSELVNSAGVVLPAYDAIRFYSSLLTESTYEGQDRYYGDAPIQLYRYFVDKSTVWILWSMDELEHEIFLDDSPKAVYDLYGNSLPAEQNQTIGIFPIYIVWDRLR